MNGTFPERLVELQKDARYFTPRNWSNWKSLVGIGFSLTHRYNNPGSCFDISFRRPKYKPPPGQLCGGFFFAEAHGDAAMRIRRLPDNSLKSVARGMKKDD